VPYAEVWYTLITGEHIELYKPILLNVVRPDIKQVLKVRSSPKNTPDAYIEYTAISFTLVRPPEWPDRETDPLDDSIDPRLYSHSESLDK
jgi:hypothetical protein